MPFDPLTGALIAGGISAGASALQGAFARKGRYRQLPTQNPQQQQRSQWAGQKAQDIYNNPMQGFDPIAQRATNQYKNQVVPALAERFTAHTNGALSSPSFASQINQGGIDLQERLAALGAQYGLQRQGLANNLLSQSQQPGFENIYEAGGPTGASSAFGALAQGAGVFGNYQMQQHLQGQQNDFIKDLVGSNPTATPPAGNIQPQRTAAQDVQSLQAPAIGQQQYQQQPQQQYNQPDMLQSAAQNAQIPMNYLQQQNAPPEMPTPVYMQQKQFNPYGYDEPSNAYGGIPGVAGRAFNQFRNNYQVPIEQNPMSLTGGLLGISARALKGRR